MTIMRGLIAAFLVTITACAAARPVAPLASVPEERALRIRFDAEVDDAHRRTMTPSQLEATARFDRTFADTLRRAGYRVSDDGPYDLRIQRDLGVHVQSPYGRGRYHHDITGVVILVSDARTNEIDRIEYRAPYGAAPASEPERVTIELVNALVDSPKIARFAADRNERGGSDDAP